MGEEGAGDGLFEFFAEVASVDAIWELFGTQLETGGLAGGGFARRCVVAVVADEGPDQGEGVGPLGLSEGDAGGLCFVEVLAAERLGQERLLLQV